MVQQPAKEFDFSWEPGLPETVGIRIRHVILMKGTIGCRRGIMTAIVQSEEAGIRNISQDNQG